jgi:predicted nucleic acid-binding protein
MVSLAPRRNLLRVFIDSSVLIAAAISATGSAHELVRLGLAGAISLHVSSLVLQETERNLARKAPRALPLYTQEFRPDLLARVTDPSQALV